jgi:hypothetical protein
MTRARTFRVWILFGIVLLALAGVSTSLVLASQTGSAPATDTWGAAADTAESRDPYAAPLAASAALTMRLPLVSRYAFTPFSYSDDFQSTGSGWPYGSGEFDYGYRTDGDSSKVYHFRMDDEDDIAFVTGPGRVAGNFDYTAWVRLATFEQPKKYFDEYGILISPTPIDPENPVVNGAYTFHVKLKKGSGVNSSWAIAKWTGPTKNARTVIREQEETSQLTDDVKVWNTFQIRRSGDQLSFWLTHQYAGALQQMWTLTDSTLPYDLHIGFYGAHSEDDLGTYRIEFQFDNVTANSAP